MSVNCQKFSVNILIALVFGLSIYAAVTRTFIWPFVPYNMFSKTPMETVDSTYIVGVLPDGRESGINLHPSRRFPYGQSDINKMIFRSLKEPDGLPKLLLAFKAFYLRQREIRVGTPEEGGWPEIKAIRAYWIRWQLKETMDNRSEPESVKLLGEV